MKRVPVSELRNLSEPELGQKRDALAQELLQLRLKSRTIGVEKPAQFRQLRRDIARVLTVMQEQQHTARSTQHTESERQRT